MEFPVLSLNQVIGLEGRPVTGSRRAVVTNYAITAFLAISRKRSLSRAAARYRSSLARRVQMIRAFLFATATQAFVVPSLFCLSAIQRLRLSVFVTQRYTTDRASWMSNMRRYGSPRFEMPNRRCLFPLECWRDTRPARLPVAGHYEKLWHRRSPR
jgi:hypothetical protein